MKILHKLYFKTWQATSLFLTWWEQHGKSWNWCLLLGLQLTLFSLLRDPVIFYVNRLALVCQKNVHRGFPEPSNVNFVQPTIERPDFQFSIINSREAEKSHICKAETRLLKLNDSSFCQLTSWLIRSLKELNLFDFIALFLYFIL